MALKTGDQVEFFYAGQTSQLPVQKKENTIYFDAEGQQIFIGEQLIASVDSSIDLSSYVTKNSATVINGLTIAPSNINKGNNNIQWTDNGFHFYAFDENIDASVPAVLDGVAEPTEDNQAANKKYVDDAIAEIPTGGDSSEEAPIEIRLSAAGSLSTYDGTNVDIPHTGPTWTELYGAISDAKEIHLIVDDGVYIVERYTSYSFDGDIEVLRFFAPSNAINLGFYTIDEGANNGLKVTYTSFPNANTLSF